MINDFLAKIPGFKQDVIYSLIAYQDLKLCLDVGAAAGITTRWIKDAGTRETRVIGFEPFPGNHPYFLQNTKTLANVELIPKAASSTTGYSSFRVLSTVQGNEKGWNQMQGYSSTGFLISGEENKPTYSSDGFQELKVETIAIADIIDTHVDFMKIDVQGGEFEVLKGCQRIIQNYGIDVMYVEFDGDRRIIELLSTLGYSIFDTDYLVIPKGDNRSLLDNMGFYDFKDLNLSTGRKAYRAKLNLTSGDYCEFFSTFRSNCGQIYTDLICVSQEFLAEFIYHLGLFSQNKPKLTELSSTPIGLDQGLTKTELNSTPLELDQGLTKPELSSTPLELDQGLTKSGDSKSAELSSISTELEQSSTKPDTHDLDSFRANCGLFS